MNGPALEFAGARRLRQWTVLAALLALLGLLGLPDAAASEAHERLLAPDARIAAVVFAASLTSSIVGFAFAALAGPPLLLFSGDPVGTVTIVVACSIATQGYCVWSLRRAIVWRAASIHRRRPCHRAPGRLAARARFALAGLAGGFSGLAGLFLVMWCDMRGMTKESQRALHQPVILAMQLEAIACLRIRTASEFPGEMLLVYAPVAVMGASAGLAIFRRLSSASSTARSTRCFSSLESC